MIDKDGKRIIGELHIHYQQDDLDEADPKKKRVYLSTLRVHPTYRRKGYGGTMVKKTLAYLREKEIKEVTMATYEENPFLQELYRRWGFTEELKHYRVKENGKMVNCILYLNRV